MTSRAGWKDIIRQRFGKEDNKDDFYKNILFIFKILVTRQILKDLVFHFLLC